MVSGGPDGPSEQNPVLDAQDWKLVPSAYLVASEPFFDERESVEKRVIYATRTASTRVISEEVWRCVSSCEFDRLPKDILSDLVSIEALVAPGEDELATVLARNNAAKADDKEFHLVIQPTRWCQLACDYCGQSHERRAMSLDDQARFIGRLERTLRSLRPQRLTVAWFGAEPLAAMGAIRRLSERLLTLSSDVGCSYDAKVVTNGLGLSIDVAEELCEQHRVSFVEVTIDGDAADHDKRRLMKSGGSTFGRIFENLVACARSPRVRCKLSVRCNVDRRNAQAPFDLLQRLASEGLEERVHFYAARVHSWGNDAHLLSLAPQEFADLECELLARMLQLGFSISPVPTLKPITCLADSVNGELVDADGLIYDCTEVSYVPSYGTPNRYATASLATDAPPQRTIARDYWAAVSRHEYPCWSCEMLPVCGGSCPKQWLEGLCPCPSAKHNIKTRLLLAYAAKRLAQGDG